MTTTTPRQPPACTCYLGPGLNLNCPQHGETVQAMKSEVARREGRCGEPVVIPYGYFVCTREPGHDGPHDGEKVWVP